MESTRQTPGVGQIEKARLSASPVGGWRAQALKQPAQPGVVRTTSVSPLRELAAANRDWRTREQRQHGGGPALL